MSSVSPPNAGLPPSQAFASAYGDPTAHEISRNYTEPVQYNSNGADHGAPPPEISPSQQPQQLSQSQHASSADYRPRLRKACDSCSLRKVKCDESGPPCRSCAALDIPCTFDRPSRRRGPPNRHAEAIKRQKLDEIGSYTSPTHDAAWSLAALASPTTLSVEAICDLKTLEVLVNDYFTYIHPLVPIPHEPTFREAFARREDLRDRSFLALFASMLEVLVASFPRRPRQLFTSEEARKRFPNAGALIDRCHQVLNDARGVGFLDRDLSLYDACSSYLAGLAAGYLFEQQRNTLYFSECVMILRRLGFHKPEREREPDSETYQFGGEDPPLEQPPNYIEQESGRRLYWLCFVGCQSIRQLGAMEGDLLMPPMSQMEKLPPMPCEVDDEYIYSLHVEPQPPDTLSLMAGFNMNVQIFRAFHSLTALEMAFGRNELYDWDRQRQLIRQSLSKVKSVTENAPFELQLQPKSSERTGSATAQSTAEYSRRSISKTNPIPDQIGFLPTRTRSNASAMAYPPRSVQYEIQKANIYATQLATRSYLVEKFWNLYELREARGGPSDRLASVSDGSPTGGVLGAGVEHTYLNRRTPSDMTDVGEQAMAVERENIVRDMAALLSIINQVNMEPNGLSFTHKIRQVASTLLETKRARMSIMPTLDSEEVNKYLIGFLEILTKLERVGTGRIRSNLGQQHHMYDAQGNLLWDTSKTTEEFEEEELVQWASLKEHQARFVKQHGFWVY